MSDFFSSVFRSFADPFFAFLQGRSVTPQIDFGNFMVGLATMIVATVSVYVSYSSGIRDSRRRVADLREEWIENLRIKLAEFSELTHRANNFALDKHTVKSNEQLALEISKINSQLVGVEYYIALMLNDQEKSHVILREIIAYCRGRVAAYCVSMETNFLSEAERLLELLEKVSRLILKSEWHRTKDEMVGRSKIRLILQMFLRKDEGHKILEDADNYLRSIKNIARFS